MRRRRGELVETFDLLQLSMERRLVVVSLVLYLAVISLTWLY